MAVHTTEAAPPPQQHRRRPWFELRKARIAAGHTTYNSLADATPFSKSYLRMLETGERTPSLNAITTLATALGIPRDDIAPAPMTESADDVARLLDTLPHGVRKQMPLEPAGTAFGNCENCDDEDGIGDARVRITWECPDSTEGNVVEVCPACLFAVVDRARSETDTEITVEYAIVPPSIPMPRAA